MMPALFLSHGSPMLAVERAPVTDFWQQLARRLPLPRAVLVVSAHFEVTGDAVVTCGVKPATLHDFGGFPPVLYQQRYPAPGEPRLADTVVQQLRSAGIPARGDVARGMDHGAWVPLRWMYPQADIPVLQLSLAAGRGPAHHWHLGEVLAPLRRERVLLLGSGGMTHNLWEWGRTRGVSPSAGKVDDFTEWVRARIVAGDREALLDYRQRAPHARFHHPSEEHLLPLFSVLGARQQGEPVARLFQGVEAGILALDAYAVGLLNT